MEKIGFGSSYRRLRKLFPKVGSKKIYCLFRLHMEQVLVDKLSLLALIAGIALVVAAYILAIFRR